MTPREKAEELVKKMTIDWDMCKGQNVECALIAVDEIQNTLTNIIYYSENYTYQLDDYWRAVRNELIKL